MSSSKDKQNYSHSRDLFTRSNGKPMYFFMNPCAERGTISEPIKYGGGVVSAKNNRKFIRLFPPDVRVIHTTGYSTKFVWDSIKANRLMDLEQYKMVEKFVDDSDDEVMNENKQTSLTMASRKTRIRMEFSLEDDMKIIKYIINTKAFNYFSSVNMWKEMADAKLFSVKRSWESLKGRFNKKILPRIASYKLNKEDVARFTNFVQSAGDDDDSEDEDEDDISVSNRSRRSGLRYTHAEDLQILNYIIEKDLIQEVKGNRVWRRMERLKVTTHSWQSMKERFIKRIVYNLSKYNINCVSMNAIEEHCCKVSDDESTPSGSGVTLKERSLSRTGLDLASKTKSKNTWAVEAFAAHNDHKNPRFATSTKRNSSAGKTSPLPVKDANSVKPKSPNAQSKLTFSSSTLPKSPQVRTTSSENKEETDSEENNFTPRKKKLKVKPLEDCEEVDVSNITSITLRTLTRKDISLLDVIPICNNGKEPQRNNSESPRLLPSSSEASLQTQTQTLENVANSNQSVSLGIHTRINLENASPSRTTGNLASDSPSVSPEKPANNSPSVPRTIPENAYPSRTRRNLASVGSNVASGHLKNTNPSVSTQNISNAGPSGMTINPVNTNPSVPPEKLVNASPSVSNSVVSLTPASPRRQSNSEEVMEIHNLLNDEVTSSDEDVNETIPVISNPAHFISNSESDSERNSQEIRELVIEILNGSHDITPKNHLALLDWVGNSLSMDSEQLSVFLEFLILQGAPSFLRDIRNGDNLH